MTGQNIFLAWTTGKRNTTENYIEIALSNWFTESILTPMDVIDSLHFPPGIAVGHFTQLIHDRNTRVGCAMVQWSDDNGLKKSTRLTCNYWRGNYGNQPVYDKGETCSDCKVCGKNEFDGLCIE